MTRVHVARNGKPTYQLWYRDAVTDRRRWRSTQTTDRREAERAAARWEAELDAADQAIDQRITWPAFVARYQAEHLTGLSPHAQATAGTAINHMTTLIRPNRLAAITPAVLSRYVAQLRARPVSETSIRTYLKHLRAALGWAKQQRLLAAVPQFPTIRTVARESAMRGRLIIGEELDRLIAAVPTVLSDPRPWQIYLEALYLSGLRLAESLIVTWDQTEPFCISYESGRPYYRIYGESQKSRRDQLLPIPPDFAAFLDQHWPARTGPLFQLPGRRNKTIRTPDAVGRIVSDLGQAAGIRTAADRTATAHDLRRSFGTRWSKKVRPEVLRQLMRHRSIQTTMTYYVHQTAADLADEIWQEKVNPKVNPTPITP
jgi:integrase